MIQERVRAGLRRAPDEGKQLGRPKIDAEIERAIQADLRRKGRPGCGAARARTSGASPM
jgi:DNA invertase Pin-like site-specific DNA recombinase